MRRALFAPALALAACYTATPTNRTPTNTVPSAVGVELSAATIADDCGDGTVPDRAAMADADADADKIAEEPCVPTSMQLSVRSPREALATTIRIHKVELVDASGAVLQTLASRHPSRWDSDGAYTPWNEQVAPGQTLAASYLLAAPDWNRLTGGRWAARGKTFQLRVTVAIGDSVRTIEHSTTTPAVMEPDVDT